MKHLLLITFIGICSNLFAQSSDAVAINTLIDNWHKAAAVADADAYFGAMSENSIYIGTDASERWSKAEFYSFGKPYFDKGNAWDFKPYDRLIQFDPSQQTAWFSELLETWMGVCRGSGIIIKENGEWKIAHYHLSVTVPNEIINDFITLINADQQTKTDAK